MASYQGVATSIPKLHKYKINILMRVTILALSLCKMLAFMQILRYTQQTYVATVMKVTHATFVQLSENYLGAKNNFLRHLEPECQWHLAQVDYELKFLKSVKQFYAQARALSNKPNKI